LHISLNSTISAKQYLATVLNLTAVYNLASGKFGHGDIVMFSIFSGLSWPSHQLLSARKYTITYRIVSYRMISLAQ